LLALATYAQQDQVKAVLTMWATSANRDQAGTRFYRAEATSMMQMTEAYRDQEESMLAVQGACMIRDRLDARSEATLMAQVA
jgi:hypothetical protein